LKALKSDFVKTQLSEQGAQPLGSSPAEYGAYIKSEIKRFGDIIKAAGIKAN
jgi:tripartite-type tricarboxylate transporter receptor subunit TctC